MRYRTSLYLAMWNLTCLGLLALAWAFGLIQDVFLSDASHITAIQAGLLILAITYATIQTWKLDRMEVDGDHHTTAQILEESLSLPSFLAADVFVYLGICGTIIGFIIFARHQTTDATPEAIAAMIGNMKVALQTAFNPTLVGVVAKIWINVMLFIQEWRTRDIHTESLLGRAQ